ncbi:DUF1206 domain-containing protein [Domibacillus iocasae]|uniref:DUF1206 domain-containing protein n=1 Tax=Domibacillus iocasae TaxID=1714016 RepID=A0A1E7DPW1_9BACI|nr:DUF1206 domain-containing protein [Domibacillus iocasae]OES45127.1 hypothetical protein BA724_03710 [Domibacillus iocasae]
MAVKNEIASKAHEAKPWIRRFGRFGQMAKGVVYALVGIFAILAAAGMGGGTTGTSGALSSVADEPFGKLLLWLIGIGLIGYVVWQLLKSIKDVEHNGSDAKGIVKRIGYLVSAVIYGSLAMTAIKLAMLTGTGGGSEKTISAKLLVQPFGQWIVGLIGLIVIIYGLIELCRGFKEKFMKYFKTYEMNNKEVRLARNAGKAGLIARGILLVMTGFFFIQTAITANPNETKGLGGALAELASQPFGQFLLGLVAVGLILYGIYEVIRGRYQRMDFGRR